MNNNQRILIVEDELDIANVVLDYLRHAGFDAEHVDNGNAAVERLLGPNPPDLIVLDVMLPGMDGLEVLRQTRRTSDAPIILLTARVEEVDRLIGLELGADDYISKPVQPRLLLARIKALLRRAPTGGEGGPSADEADELEFGNFRISQATRSTYLGNDIIDLTTAEFDLLWLLARHAGNILSRDDLLQELRGIGFDGLDRSIDARISRLRRKLGDDPENPTRIKTVRGKGYLFSKHDWQ